MEQQKQVVRLLEAGDFFGEKFFVDEQITLPFNVIADSSTTVISSIGFGFVHICITKGE